MISLSSVALASSPELSQFSFQLVAPADRLPFLSFLFGEYQFLLFELGVQPGDLGDHAIFIFANLTHFRREIFQAKLERVQFGLPAD